MAEYIPTPGPALPPDPPHPEPHTMTWSKLELEAIRAYARQAVEAREADTARLDFLDTPNQRFRMGWKVGVAPAGNKSVTSIICVGNQPVPTIREAIDAAIAAAGSKT